MTQAQQTFLFICSVLSFKDDKTSVLCPASRPKQSEHVRHRGVRGRRQEPSLSQDGADLVAEVKLYKLQNQGEVANKKIQN